MSERTECVVGYKRAWIEGSGRLCFGDCFDRLIPCCDKFKKCFEETGNIKSTDYNHNNIYDAKAKPGINLVVRGELKLLLGGDIKFEINFCPFCAAKVTVKQIRTVSLRSKYKQERDGYEELESQFATS